MSAKCLIMIAFAKYYVIKFSIDSNSPQYNTSPNWLKLCRPTSQLPFRRIALIRSSVTSQDSPHLDTYRINIINGPRGKRATNQNALNNKITLNFNEISP
jgi:hypothetical protein